MATLLPGTNPQRVTSADWITRYQLTDAEAAILAAAVTGKTRNEVARSPGTSVDTIKKQAHVVLAKTGDRSLLAATTRFFSANR